ncbi:MAG: hypothetical protein P857_779 [Candidatus Xenolissoclinum pacificiensis L6]|uniref:Uncharacterized protein n=1 Tax=Candidatus Xenolissoclinum pacificiensis L6 TaxID=1401685 RepID=W2V0I0_9RICK|nr:MAG: hypothetical protein P857_779 [Candidatus Xenolissoclinum pacificiensis L6]
MGCRNKVFIARTFRGLSKDCEIILYSAENNIMIAHFMVLLSR